MTDTGLSYFFFFPHRLFHILHKYSDQTKKKQNKTKQNQHDDNEDVDDHRSYLISTMLLDWLVLDLLFLLVQKRHWKHTALLLNTHPVSGLLAAFTQKYLSRLELEK